MEAAEDPTTLKARIVDLEDQVALLTRENERLENYLTQLRHRAFGRSSEKSDLSQLPLFALAEAAPPEPDPAPGAPQPGPARRRGGGRQRLPEHLPRVTREILPDSTACPCCQRAMARIGEDVTERLHLIPARAEVERTVRPKFACRACGEIAQAKAPEDQPLARAQATAQTMAQVVIGKWLYHLPLNRQAALFGRLGVLLSTSSLYGWVAAVAGALVPLQQRLHELLLARPTVHADDTPVVVLNPDGPGTHDGRFWVYADDTRPRGRPEPSIVVFRFSAGRAGCHPQEHLKGFAGNLQADAFAGFNALYADGTVVEAGCMAHARRKLVEQVRATASPVAREGIRQIGELYQIEQQITGLSAGERQAIRQEQAVPILDGLRRWLDQRRAQLAPRSELAKALNYLHEQWDALIRYTTDGTLEIDNLIAERALRGVAVGRRNWNTVGSDSAGEISAVIYSLVETCKLNGVNPEAYLRDVISRIETTKYKDIDTLLPFNWKPADGSSPIDLTRANLHPQLVPP